MGTDLNRSIERLTDKQAAVLLYDWATWARTEQLEPPGEWTVWLLQAGRGAGKTRSGAEWIRHRVEKGARRIGLIARTAADARDVMVEGEAGILAVSPPWDRPVYEPSKRRLSWRNGAVGTIYSADKPDLLRGPQHDTLWCDELAAWRRLAEAWDNAMLGLRLGRNPRCVVTTTPKPRAKLKEILQSSATKLTCGSTFDNLANLAPAFRDKILSQYKGTRLARQEIHGEYLEDVPGALWTRAMIMRAVKPKNLVRIVVAIDPAASTDEEANDTGIVAAGMSDDGRFYVLADRTCHLSPLGWAQQAIETYRGLSGDRIVGEVNNGGEMVETVLRQVDASIPFSAVHATRGKILRAEPVAALYEQGKVFHCGEFPELEDQMCSYTASDSDRSPDRLDALVWALTELMPKVEKQTFALEHEEPVQISSELDDYELRAGF